MATKKCGDCIHAEICKQVNSGWFSPKNIAYCTAFKERKNCVEVVRCKDCESFEVLPECDYGEGYCWLHEIDTLLMDFCSYGERKDNDNK